MSEEKFDLKRAFNSIELKYNSKQRKFKNYRPIYYNLDTAVNGNIEKEFKEDTITIKDLLLKPEFKLKDNLNQNDPIYKNEINKILHTMGNENTPTTIGLLNRSYNSDVLSSNNDLTLSDLETDEI